MPRLASVTQIATGNPAPAGQMRLRVGKSEPKRVLGTLARRLGGQVRGLP
jgi:hypothetical protein